MFGSLGSGELLVILLVALLIFGSKRMPEIGRAIGRGIREFNRARQEVTDTLTRMTEEVEKPIADLQKEVRDATEIGVGTSVKPEPNPTAQPEPKAPTDSEESSDPYSALIAASRKTHPPE
jgi:sec-independent protein translocase protein TatA